MYCRSKKWTKSYSGHHHHLSTPLTLVLADDLCYIDIDIFENCANLEYLQADLGISG